MLTLYFGRCPLGGSHIRDSAFSQEFQRHPLSCHLVLPDPDLSESALAQELAHLINGCVCKHGMNIVCVMMDYVGVIAKVYY